MTLPIPTVNGVHQFLTVNTRESGGILVNGLASGWPIHSCKGGDTASEENGSTGEVIPALP